MSDVVSVSPFIILQAFLQIVFQSIFFNIFIALTLGYLEKARAKTQHLNEINARKDNAIIEREIKRDARKKAEKESKKSIRDL